MYEDKTGRSRFRLKAGNGETVAVGEAYETLAAAKEGCAAVQRAADGASVVDVLPDDTEFSVVTWFGYDYWHMVMPLARLITEETVPPDVESRSPAVMR